MTEIEWKNKLFVEGYTQIWRHIDAPYREYGAHEHPVDTVHVVLEGEMLVEINGNRLRLKSGDRLNTPKNTAHGACMGPEGCILLIGIKI